MKFSPQRHKGAKVTQSLFAVRHPEYPSLFVRKVPGCQCGRDEGFRREIFNELKKFGDNAATLCGEIHSHTHSHSDSHLPTIFFRTKCAF